jgi:hypothetical protein
MKSLRPHYQQKGNSAMKALNLTLIFRLSLFGLAMSIATVFWIPSNAEPLFWLAIFIACAILIAKQADAKFFLHGFLTSLVNCVWITLAHIIFAESYLAQHAQEAAMMASSPFASSPRLMMLATGPVIGVASGLVLGLFCFVAAKIFRKDKAPALNEKSGNS